jgi:hypothetical protein
MRIRRPNSTLLTVIALAVAVAGCGSSSDQTQTAPPATGTTEPPASTSTAPGSEAPVGVRAKSCKGASDAASEIRVTGVSCATGRSTVAAWSRNGGCSSPAGASRTSCKLGGLTCLGAVTDRGVAVTCAEAGRSISFVGKRG